MDRRVQTLRSGLFLNGYSSSPPHKTEFLVIFTVSVMLFFRTAGSDLIATDSAAPTSSSDTQRAFGSGRGPSHELGDRRFLCCIDRPPVGPVPILAGARLVDCAVIHLPDIGRPSTRLNVLNRPFYVVGACGLNQAGCGAIHRFRQQ